jgi:hypothetical protein
MRIASESQRRHLDSEHVHEINRNIDGAFDFLKTLLESPNDADAIPDGAVISVDDAPPAARDGTGDMKTPCAASSPPRSMSATTASD